MQSNAYVGEGIFEPPFGGSIFDPTWVNVPLSQAPFVEAGKQYRLTLVTDWSVNPYSLGIATSDVYSGGEFFYSYEESRTPCVSWSNVGSSDWDLGFETYVTPDTAVPTVDVVTPAGGAQDVARGSSVTATFSEEVQAVTLTSSTVQLFSGNSPKPIKATLSVDPSTDPTSVTLTPSKRLDAKTR